MCWLLAMPDGLHTDFWVLFTMRWIGTHFVLFHESRSTLFKNLSKQPRRNLMSMRIADTETRRSELKIWCLWSAIILEWPSLCNLCWYFERMGFSKLINLWIMNSVEARGCTCHIPNVRTCAWANFVNWGSLLLHFCTEASYRLMTPAHTVFSTRLRPKDRFHVSPW